MTEQALIPSATATLPLGPAPCVPQLRLYQDWLRDTRGLQFDDYDALWRWSTTDLDAFWHSMWDWGRVQSPTPPGVVLADARMPGAQWFPGTQLNFARQVLAHADAAQAAAKGRPAIISDNELGEVRELSWPELRRQVASLALGLRAAGVQRGDRVAAYLPNVPEAIVACLAVLSVGAIWSVCAPDMGTAAVADRFRQIEPKLLIAVDGVYYGGKPVDRAAVVAELQAQLPSLQHTLLIRTPHAKGAVQAALDWQQEVSRFGADVDSFEPEYLPFDHPIWIVYSSGTTGLPKPIVHGHGGIVLTAHAVGLHNDVGPSYAANTRGERFHWYSSTGWVMWNVQMMGLLYGCTIVLYDGHPAGSKDQPDWGVLWRFAAKHHVNFFGAGAAYYSNCMKAGLQLADCGDLSAIRTLGSTGSPLSEAVQRWGTEQMYQVQRQAGQAQTPVYWCNISGGTDFCGAFAGGNRLLPEVPGRMQCRMLGHAVESWNEAGQPVIGEVGELVCVQPIPSMPLRFWNDPGNARYLSSYFDVWPGIWRHGDWLQIDPDGGCTIFGRSDATINRQGLRMGTSEIYSAIETLPEVLDSMVVDLEYLGRDSFMPLFVVLRPGSTLDEARPRIEQAIRQALSPRFLPDEIVVVAQIPRTLTGKKQELPIKKLMLGQPAAQVINLEAMANPECMDWYLGYAQRHLAKTQKQV